MSKKEPIPLTSTEMGLLWTTYINDTMSICILKHFLSNTEDSKVKGLIEVTLGYSNQHVETLRKLLKEENFPIPQGFSEEDVNIRAKRLFSDYFYLYYIKNMAKVGLAVHSQAYSMSTRADVRIFFGDCLQQVMLMDQKATELLQSKGLFIRPPHIPIPERTEFVESRRFLSGGFFGFRDKRPLTTIEISHLFSNVQTNALGKALLIGFSQVVQSEEIRKYLQRGADISAKHVKVFSDFLLDDNLPTPMTWESEITTSTEVPFSDKLILFHMSLLVAAGTGNYGVAAAASPRKDIALAYVRLAAEIAVYAEDGAVMMIKHGYLEEPPEAPDREALAQR
ncbi:DUF3231 family protein [Paenibacillus physcomitrellae]|uniref:DUF3231 family protein n=1 Tax=Paenibacillus physcomitrellae TaxID=1619311 RepID=A0ABQ1FXE8_9BACL|nr:DUF3231 family protein [Paenibacillus physcomitrellae]GGA32323.1 hypothetical protein GCM10010917_16770 [Paenibacillus physcomitrellae]